MDEWRRKEKVQYFNSRRANRLMQEHRAAVKLKRAASVNIRTTYRYQSLNQILFLLFSFFRIFNVTRSVYFHAFMLVALSITTYLTI